ncbi:MAG: cell division protein FtsZ [Candidatus Kapabacteria bacterium]|nr:cell division protein FtsZ [Ignavibacteriota bacterium]MCW5885608.1 cell division protein FtsZ [Candidatus Kapabacteria bacterium]
MAIGIAVQNSEGAKLRVVGVGGGGGNAVNNMIKDNLEGIEFIVANTDKQALDQNLAKVKIQLGKELTKGLGAGGNPETGKNSAEESSADIKEILRDTDMIFVTAGMGGGTGTGAAPVLAKIAREMGALVVGIVTKPFDWEGKKRIKSAQDGIEALRGSVDALIVIHNQKLLDVIDKNISFQEAFRLVDDVLYKATKGISQLISTHGIVNVDFADVKAVMKDMGDAIMGIGYATGDNRAVQATENALKSPLLGNISIKGSKGVLVNVSGSSNLSMHEIASAVSVVEKAAGDDANIIHGVTENEELGDTIMVTVVATGFKLEENKIVEKVQKVEAMQEPIISNNGKANVKQTSEVPNIKTKMPVPTLPKPTNVASPWGKVAAFNYDKAPKGEDKLKGFDIPTYQRMGININAPEVLEHA